MYLISKNSQNRVDDSQLDMLKAEFQQLKGAFCKHLPNANSYSGKPENIYVFHQILTGVMVERDPKQHENKT